MTKRTLDAFIISTPSKKIKRDSPPPPSEEQKASTNLKSHDFRDEPSTSPPTTHPTYPFPVPSLPPSILDIFQYSPAKFARHINDQPHLDLLYYDPFIDRKTATTLFRFLRRELFFYRVKYTIKRGPVETQINTPRFTTVFGVDETSVWQRNLPDTNAALLEATTKKPVDTKKYSCCPRPIPECLESLRRATEAVTGETFNFCLVNYYADGNDSISYHSDDERFLGPAPSIASFSLGSGRDFLMKPKTDAATSKTEDAKPVKGKKNEDVLKLPLQSGDMVLMKGETQGKWLHSIPKRKGGQGDGGRINITFRKAMVKGGTENYYRYNVGSGNAHRWGEGSRTMVSIDDKEAK